jgi:dipeptidyl aminopeptidase/acylaminoacyl peptidase
MSCFARSPVRVLSLLSLCCIFVLLVPLAPHATAAKKSGKKKADEETAGQTIESWLVAGPVAYPLPVFADADEGGIEIGDVLDATLLADPRLRPKSGEAVAWFAGKTLRWTAGSSGKTEELKLERATDADGVVPGVAWLVAYLRVGRWRKMELTLEGTHPRHAWLNGEPLASGTGDAEAAITGKLELTPGTHVLLLKTVLDPERDDEWTIGATLRDKSGESSPEVTVSLDPTRDLTIGDITDPPQITSLALSPDGGHVVASVRRIVPGTHDTESWVEIRRTSDGSLEDSWRGATGARQVDWSPGGRYISYVAKAATGEDASTLFLFDRRTGRVFPLLESVTHLGGYLWSPTEQAIVFSTTKKAEKDERGVKLLEGLLDRWADYRDKQFLHLVTVPDGNRRRLTAGALTTSAAGFSPDGTRLLFTRRLEQLDARPFTMTELWEMDLKGFGATKLREFRWFNTAEYGPEGKRLLIGAPADEFGEQGVDLSQTGIPNSYDGQLYIWDPASDEAEAITRDFDPAVSSATWSWRDGRIYLTAEERDLRPVFRYDPPAREYERLDTGFDVNRRLEVARTGPVAVALGSSSWVPWQLLAVDLSTGTARGLRDPAGDWFEGVRMGTVEPWSFTAANGKLIDGRIYFPPEFDAAKSYPAIVYYYGGTSPVGRDFGGRYPKEWWAANGYVVYVLQPSGATGFGQDFSAAHVNDWGNTTTEEIIEGTRKFLKAHSFVDPARVGCIGASYGGFMTMLLSTKTDVFAAAVSHAGISSLSSYWGEGYWGYLYSAVATAESYPWNRKDIYVDQSPLFRADQHRVPILLTHGVADTNVPVGESDSFYIALKLLGKDVEYLQIEGENHWILGHEKRTVWSRSIVAWFDRWLKDQPSWWDALYPGASSSGSELAE